MHRLMIGLIAGLLVFASARAASPISYRFNFWESIPAEGIHPAAENGRIFVSARWIQEASAELTYGGVTTLVPVRTLAPSRGISVFEIEAAVPAGVPFEVRVSSADREEPVRWSRTFDFIAGDGKELEPVAVPTSLTVHQPLETWCGSVHVDVPPVAGAGAYVLTVIDDDGVLAAVDAEEAREDGATLLHFGEDDCGEVRCYSVHALGFDGSAAESETICVELGGGVVDPSTPDDPETYVPPYGCSSTQPHSNASWLAMLLAAIAIGRVFTRSGRGNRRLLTTERSTQTRKAST